MSQIPSILPQPKLRFLAVGEILVARLGIAKELADQVEGKPLAEGDQNRVIASMRTAGPEHGAVLFLVTP